jgi:hypothetical protein
MKYFIALFVLSTSIGLALATSPSQSKEQIDMSRHGYAENAYQLFKSDAVSFCKENADSCPADSFTDSCVIYRDYCHE